MRKEAGRQARFTHPILHSKSAPSWKVALRDLRNAIANGVNICFCPKLACLPNRSSPFRAHPRLGRQNTPCPLPRCARCGQHGAVRCGQCGLPRWCYWVAGWWSLHTWWLGWQQQHAVAFANTCHGRRHLPSALGGGWVPSAGDRTQAAFKSGWAGQERPRRTIKQRDHKEQKDSTALGGRSGIFKHM